MGALTVVVDGVEAGACRLAGAVTGAVTGDDDAMGPAAGAACTERVPNQQLQLPNPSMLATCSLGNTAEPEPKPCGFCLVCTLSGTAGHVGLGDIIAEPARQAGTP